MIGIFAGIGYYVTEHLMIRFRIDDPVGSVPVHFCGGTLGVLLTPIFAGRKEEYSMVFWKGIRYLKINLKNVIKVVKLTVLARLVQDVFTLLKPLQDGLKGNVSTHLFTSSPGN